MGAVVRVAPPVKLSPEERARLHRWARRSAPRDFRSLRARIVLHAAEGLQDVEIGSLLGIGRATASRWRRRFLTLRTRGLERHLAPRIVMGRVPEERIRSIVRAGWTRDPTRNRPWSTRKVADATGVSHTTVRRIWEAYHVRPTRFEPWSARPDPGRPFVLSDVVGVYLRPPDYAVSFSLEPPWSGGASPVRAVAPNPSEGLESQLRFTAAPSSTKSSSESRVRGFLRFLTELGMLGKPPLPILVIATTPGLPTGGPVGRWRASHPSVRFEFLAGADQWRGRLHRALSEIGRRSGSARFGARGELVRAIRLFLGGFSATDGPFQWVASPGEATTAEAGFRLRYDLSVSGHRGLKMSGSVGRPVDAGGAVDPRAREVARVILRRSLRVRRNERVTIETWSETLPYANALVLEALRIGARPLLFYQDEPTYWAAASEVPPANLARLGEHQRAAMERSDVFVSFFGPSDRERFHALPRSAKRTLVEYRNVLYRAAARTGTRAVQIALGRASDASARLYGADLAQWRNELVEGILVDPEELHRRAIPIAHRLRSGHEVEIRHPNGTELRLGLRQRTPAISDGRVPRARARGSWDVVQLPAGVVMVALDERCGEGTFRSNVTNSVGVMDSVGEVAEGQWTFEKGRLTRFSYEQGQELFAQSYGRAGAGRDSPGVLSIGLNERIDRAPLLMDQAYGTVTLQIGRNDNLGGRTATYWWAWLILRGADVTVDGDPILRSGRLVH